MARQANSVDRNRYDNAVCRRLKVAMFNADVEMKQLAQAADIPYGTLYNLMHGIHSPSVFCIAKICRALHLDANEILGVRR